MSQRRRMVARFAFGVLLSALLLFQLQVASQVMRNGYHEKLQIDSPLTRTIRSFTLDTEDGGSSPNETKNSGIQLLQNSTPGIAVCFSFQDDNMILPEWLAYHYTTLPLRHLVLLQDPTSRTSPREILERWNQSRRIQAWIWNDEDVVPPLLLTYHQELANEHTQEADHFRLKERQRHFAAACNQFFKRLSVTEPISWVGHFDVDEFVVPNRVANWEDKLRRKRKQESAAHLQGNLNYKQAIQIRQKFFQQLQSQNSSSLLTALQVLEASRYRYTTPDCIPMARWNHGTKVLKETTDTWTSKTGTINTSRLETLQYLRGDHPVRPVAKLMGKMMVDVRRIPMTNMSESISPHRPLPSPFCGKANVNFLESFLVLNHYRGSWERYSFRNDARRTYDQWEMENANYWKIDSTHYKIYNWVSKFIELVGSEEQAAYLLGHRPHL